MNPTLHIYVLTGLEDFSKNFENNGYEVFEKIFVPFKTYICSVGFIIFLYFIIA